MSLDEGSRLLLALLASQLVIIGVALFLVWLRGWEPGAAGREAGKAKRPGPERPDREGSDERR
jgi:hypothetical protein